MREGLNNRDSVFFTIESPDVSLNEKNLSRYLEEFSITEALNEIPTGTLRFNDPDNTLSHILRRGARIKLSWGYKEFGIELQSLLPIALNFDEVTGPLIRRGYEVYIYNPSGGGDQNGKVTYNCNFTALNFRGTVSTKEYTTGTKRNVVVQAMTEIGVNPLFQYINFTYQSDAVTAGKSIRQDESTYAFLTRLALEWGAVFYLCFLPTGGIGGVFVHPYVLKNNNIIPLWVNKSIGKSHMFGYKDEISNVISYTWTSNEGENGIGDNVNVEIINGEIVFKRFVAENETVTTYKLDVQKLQNEYKDLNNDLEATTKFTKELLSKKTFEQIKHYFIPCESSTAPQGYGYSIKAHMIGNPLLSPPNQIRLNKGFPSQLGGTQSIWYLRSVTHTISNAGYFSDIEVIDVFNISPVGLVIL